MITYLDRAGDDPLLVGWVHDHFAAEAGSVIVYHSSRIGATVPRGDLVNKQYRLADHRHVRVVHVSASYRSGHLEPRKIYVIAEVPKK
jgi:hypothetical protein